jgi:type VI secretion system secreted protein VgrG
LTGQDLGGKTLTPGVYCFDSSAQLTGVLTLNAAGDPNAVFIFKIGSTLTTASGSSVSTINGAQSCNVSWQVVSSATLGTTTAFRGTIMALVSITATTSATVNGRLLARTGAVTLDTNVIIAQNCSATVAAAAAEAAAYNTAQTAAAQAAATAAAAAAAAARLPSTGVAPTHSNTPTNIAVVLATVFALSTSFVLIRRKKRAI